MSTILKVIAGVILVPVAAALLLMLAVFLYYLFMVMLCVGAGWILYAFGLMCGAMH